MRTLKNTNLSSKELSFVSKSLINPASVETHLKINEIFYSIQGESLFAGKPTVFVRVATCNLRCTYCDTRYAFWEGRVRSVEDVMTEVRQFPTKFACLTGGEPLGQKASYELMRRLAGEGYTVSLETGGGFSVKDVPASIIKILDVKTPESGECGAMVWENLDLMTSQDQIKFVVCSKADFDWAAKLCQDNNLFDKCPILISPVADKVPYAELAQWTLESALPFTMQLQLHKVIWGNQRGV